MGVVLMLEQQIKEADKIDLAPWGYAPGMTLFYCSDCRGDDPSQGHRYATRCVTHALEARMKDIRALEPAEALQEDDYIPPPCYASKLLRIMFFGAVISAGFFLIAMTKMG
jgi:hypothetical protein